MIEVKLAPNGSTLVAVTRNGLEVQLDGGAPGMTQLVRMLQAQAKAKTVPAPTGLSDWHYVLAEWERIGPEGAGKIRKAPIKHGRLPDEGRPGDFARQYDSRGRVTQYSPLDELEPL
jgi:hypothetical protein